MKKIRVGSAVLIVKDDKILLGKRKKTPNFGKWVLPGGKIEFGETHQEAGVREAKEELGLDISIEGLAGNGLYYLTHDETHRIIIYSYAKPLSDVISASSDISEARFFTKEELINLDISDIVLEVLKDSNWV